MTPLNDLTIDDMLYFLVLTPSDCAWLEANVIDSESRKGMINPRTLSLPKVDTAKAIVVAESMPPDKPKTTPSAPASFTRVWMNFSIIREVSGNSFTSSSEQSPYWN